jgi:poly(3-hydroxybutyrate) depolymerase
MILSHLAAVWVAASQIMNIEAYATPRDFPLPLCKGCWKALPKGQAVGTVSNVTVLSGGVQRSYLISIPPTYNPKIPAPIIFSYHGGVRTAEDQLQLDHLTDPEFNTVSLVIYPQGINVC